MIRDIILYPDGRLETPCDMVTEFDTTGLHQLVADLFETMYFNKGLGLAAPQICVMKQVAVIDPSSGRDPEKKVVLINPRITEAQGTQCDEEGCLSFPDFIERITRSMSVIVDARDSAGAAVHLQCDGLLSRVLQHEIDHLNGILFIRHMSSLKRELIRRKIRKMFHAGDWGPVRGSQRNDSES
jgi:peptide deformylase